MKNIRKIINRYRLYIGGLMLMLSGGFLDGDNIVMAVISMIIMGFSLYPYMEASNVPVSKKRKAKKKIKSNI